MITDLEAFRIAVPFKAPIFSAYGVRIPTRILTYTRLHTDAGITGVGQTGVSATHKVSHAAQMRLFENRLLPQSCRRKSA